MQLASSPSDSRFPAPAHPDQPYSAASYASTAGAYNQYSQGLPGQPEARDGQQTFQLDTPTTTDEPTKSTTTRTRKRKTTPPKNHEEVGAAPPSAGPGQPTFGYPGEGPGQPPTSEQTQQGPGYPLDPNIQSFPNDGSVGTDHEREALMAPGGPAGSARIVNPSKRAEQNRKAQRAFRERRDAHVKELEGRSAMLDQVMVDLAETNRRFEECRHMVDALRSENQRLTAALQQFTGGQLPPGFSQPAYPSGAPPLAENEAQNEANPAIIMPHAPPIESITHPPTNNNEPEVQSGTEDGGAQEEASRKSKRAKR